jgi:hypothetical protein
MKTILLLLTSIFCTAQSGFRINKMETFNFTIVLDPHASIKEKGVSIGAAIEYSGSVYTRASITSFPKLKGSYIELKGAFGMNFTSGYFEKIRYYAGGRLGFINIESTTYPTAGIEAGINIDLGDTAFLGVRGTYDKRSDSKFYNEPSKMKGSSYLLIGFKF